MKNKLFILIFLLIIPKNIMAQDFIVKFLAEHYKETEINDGRDIKIYHTLQVETQFGNKLLMLDGNDFEYRNWLREYLGDHDTFVIKISDQNLENYISSKAFSIDVKNIHPIIKNKWHFESEVKSSGKIIPEQEKAILLVDDDEKRLSLAADLIKHLGYNVVARPISSEALEIFKAEPERFKMLITDNIMPGMSGMQLAKQILNINSELPVILCTEYDEEITDKIKSEAGVYDGKIIIKPVMLKDLGKIIRKIIK